MTDEEKIAYIKLRIGDVPGNPFYPMYTDTEYQLALAANKGDVDKTVRMMAISAAMMVSTMSTREVIDDFVIENAFGTNYLKALDYLINDPIARVPENLLPVVITKDCDRVKLMDVADFSCSGQHKSQRGCGC